jgi:regulator of nonsense transcripts 1
MANPLTTLVIDEASQIEVGDYVAVFSKYVSSLRKLCFIGDDKQLPPHGQEEIESLQSIFEVAHLRDLVILLDTQYRMPPQIGDFISHAVYDNKLLSNPEHPITSKTIACYLIDVCEGTEKRDGTSFKNLAECDAVLQIAEHLQNKSQSYRIITPYDPQTKAIEEGMKEKQLNWEDKCFNVDSFQGNEDDYIIISTVRSKELGFLRNKRRTNVMLSRCKRGMFICTNRAFLEGAAATSLVGELAAEFSKRGWVERKDLEEVLSKF